MKEKVSQKTKKRQAKSSAAPCESCEFYDYDEYTDSYSCQRSLDEDEFAAFACGNSKNCPYYRFYDEYKSVQKQN